jgi:hypothetical protein
MTATMKTEHTTTPWSISRIDLSGTTIVHGRQIIAQLDCAEFERQDVGNAALIVRAVNSFEAMKQALEWIEEICNDEIRTHKERGEIIKNFMSVYGSAALKLANGEQP